MPCQSCQTILGIPLATGDESGILERVAALGAKVSLQEGGRCGAVMQRVLEYTGTIVNSNMRSHESFARSTDKVVVEVRSADGSHTRRVGLCAVLTDAPGLYKAHGAGVTIDDPWETLRLYKTALESESNVDLVVPLCHLYEFQDERTCREFDFPLVLSGHDHHVVDRVVAGTRLLKPGQDCRCATVVDITWGAAGGAAPVIAAESVPVAGFAPDAVLAEEAEAACAVLDHLAGTELAEVPPALRPLTSWGSRERHVSMGTFLCNTLRDGLNVHCPQDQPQCDCVILKGGNIRGGKDYADHEKVTYASLLSETGERDRMHVYKVPGKCLKVMPPVHTPACLPTPPTRHPSALARHYPSTQPCRVCQERHKIQCRAGRVAFCSESTVKQ